ncbi:DUF4321 domain-containing protein [Paenibacillus sp. HB172176]|uniref:DUF4321 domain-containing protein n=1 Tax=Paenibacillus sp. HB172176 TaxID=2493690 RepID=UPI001438CC6F|nr:DUF4321 domain-containing protein [Paenibacillus sp. HB172176]
MKKNGWILFLFLVLGLIAGALVARWLDSVPGLTFLTRSIETTWTPSFDLYVLTFSMNLTLQLSLCSIIGAAAAIWLYRKV